MRKVRNFDKKVKSLVEELANMFSLGYVGEDKDAFWIWVRKNPVKVNFDGTFEYTAVKYPEYDEVVETVSKYFKQK